MAQCTAPQQGHRTASGRANCPACGTNSYHSINSYPTHTPTPRSTAGLTCATPTGPRKSFRAQTAITLSPKEYETLKPVHEQAVKQAEKYPDKRDIFLCHAWGDRTTTAKELHDALEQQGLSVWFSEKDIKLGTSLTRSIDKGLKDSRVGLILVTPAFYRSIDAAGIAEQELSALLRTDRVFPVVHNTDYEELAEMSPLLASRSGLSTEGSSLKEVAEKIAEAVLLD